jgi:hypothetical protein
MSPRSNPKALASSRIFSLSCMNVKPRRSTCSSLSEPSLILRRAWRSMRSLRVSTRMSTSFARPFATFSSSPSSPSRCPRRRAASVVLDTTFCRVNGE